jgi:hypothetical protein
MKVLDLQCAHAHGFEGWFGSEDDFQSQLARGLVECPICSDTQITKKLSAPRLNLSESRASRQNQPAPASSAASAPSEIQAPQTVATSTDPKAQEMLAAYWRMAREIVSKTEDMGHRFPELARQIHHGDVPERAIRGQATPQEARELAEEGIAVMALPLPKGLTEPLQ